MSPKADTVRIDQALRRGRIDDREDPVRQPCGGFRRRRQIGVEDGVARRDEKRAVLDEIGGFRNHGGRRRREGFARIGDDHHGRWIGTAVARQIEPAPRSGLSENLPGLGAIDHVEFRIEAHDDLRLFGAPKREGVEASSLQASFQSDAGKPGDG